MYTEFLKYRKEAQSSMLPGSVNGFKLILGPTLVFGHGAAPTNAAHVKKDVLL